MGGRRAAVDHRGLPYDFNQVEAACPSRWQRDPVPAPDGAPFYNLVEFSYPSAEGLHVGHVMGYCGAGGWCAASPSRTAWRTW